MTEVGPAASALGCAADAKFLYIVRLLQVRREATTSVRLAPENMPSDGKMLQGQRCQIACRTWFTPSKDMLSGTGGSGQPFSTPCLLRTSLKPYHHVSQVQMDLLQHNSVSLTIGKRLWMIQVCQSIAVLNRAASLLI